MFASVSGLVEGGRESKREKGRLVEPRVKGQKEEGLAWMIIDESGRVTDCGRELQGTRR